MEDVKEIDSTSSKCPSCGSELYFDPKTQGMKCVSCGSEFKFPLIFENNKHDLDLTNQSVSTDEWAKESKVVHCQTCGASVIATGLAVTQVCPYCGSKYVIQENVLPGIKPDYVVPFVIDKKDAAEKFKAGIKKKFFVPSGLKKAFTAEEIKGIYIPAFAFDANTKSSYDGILTRTKTISTKNGTKVVTESFPIHGNFDFDYMNLLIESSTQLNDSQLESLLPYNLDKSCKFDAKFLMGYYVEHYNDAISKCYELANKKIARKIESGILSKYNYSGVTCLNVKTSRSDEKYNYQLLPIYYVSYSYKKKKYSTYMNGQTGKVGKGLPVSALKVLLCVIIVLVIIAIFMLLICFLD